MDYQPQYQFLRYDSTSANKNRFESLEKTLSKIGQTIQIFGDGFEIYQTYNFKFENGMLKLYDNLAQINEI